uniref:phospholipase D n=1 Tax=Sinocyclocheilus grahami TaxID=75366 RepID=A0A672R3S1_SINGR
MTFTIHMYVKSVESNQLSILFLFPLFIYLKEGCISPLIHGTPITCKVENTERYTTRSKVHVCTLYTICLTHGEFTWMVKRKYKHFQELHRDLYKHKMILQFFFLLKVYAIWTNGQILYKNCRGMWFYACLLKCVLCSQLDFLAISPLSFIKDLGPKGLRDPGVVSFVLLFDPELKVLVGSVYTDTKHGVCIENFSRKLVIKCSSYRQAQWWSHEIRSLSERCDFLQTHRFEGFAPPRPDTLTKWYVNGNGYFSDVADALEQAKEEIFITDWWLSPEVFLKRPATGTYWRLDKILRRKAEQGVKVCVLLYKELELALGISSVYSKRTLMNLHPNIKVMRHPDHVASVVFLWAHHEKMVAIDQSVAFVGGLDLAFGRWDDSDYRLSDVEPSQLEAALEVQLYPVDMMAYLINVSISYSLSFCSDAVDGSAVPLTEPVSECEDEVDLSYNALLWLGKDYSNFIKRDWTQLDQPFQDKLNKPLSLPPLFQNQFFISCSDQKNVLNTIGDAIVKRILRAHSEGKKYRVFVVIPLLPGFEGDISQGGGNAIQAILHFTYRTINRGEQSILSRLKEQMQDEWTQYISLCGLRTHSELGQSPVTELIYVHSKALIADDRCYIIGSANINDRSMLGSRDSELAVLVEDEERVPSVMNGEEYQAGPLALALRKECFSVLLGAKSDPNLNIDDPVCDNFFNDVWNKIAQTNAIIYEKVFRCLPLDSIRNLRELQEHVNAENLSLTYPEKAKEELQAIQGILVHFPLHFLCEEYLLPPLKSKERMVPMEVWT